MCLFTDDLETYEYVDTGYVNNNEHWMTSSIHETWAWTFRVFYIDSVRKVSLSCYGAIQEWKMATDRFSKSWYQ